MKQIFIFNFLLFFTGYLFASPQNTRKEKKTSIAESGIASNKIIPHSAEIAQPLNVFFDYYHHALPSVKVGNYITTGSWIDDKGRYGWDDFVHTNTLDHLYTVLEKDYQIFKIQEPYSKDLLKKTDMVVIVSADDPNLVPGIPTISDKEITALQNFVDQGGSLMVIVNAGGPTRIHEGFEKEQLGKLVRGFGLYWDDNQTHYSDNKIPVGHPYFYDVENFHYGAGCTISILPDATKAEVLLEVYSDPSYTDLNVRGPGIVMVRSGKGKFMLVGDIGSWTGNMSRPWADNVRVLKQMFLHLRPNREAYSQTLIKDKILEYEVKVSGLQAIPTANSLSKIENMHYKLFSPRPTTNIPYFERSGNLQLVCKELANNGEACVELKFPFLTWFEDVQKNEDEQCITFNVSRQGKVRNVKTEGFDAQWLSPDISLLMALLPTDGLRPGDRWNSIEPIRIPIIEGDELSPVRNHDVEIVYVRDTELDGKECRLLRTSDEIWLDEFDVKVEELLPQELVRQVGGMNYQYFEKHGGKILFKREQWVDKETGVVLKAKNQTRIIAWIHDKRRPIPVKNVDKDNQMIVSIAHIIDFQLK